MTAAARNLRHDPIIAKAGGILTMAGVDRWLEIEEPDLGCTPAQAIADGRYDDVDAVLDAYMDPSYT